MRVGLSKIAVSGGLILLLAGCIPAGRPEPEPARPAPPPRRNVLPPVAAAGEVPVTPPQVAHPRPAWQARAVVANAVDVAESTYTVRPGDTLSRIGERTGAGAQAIARENGLQAPYAVQVGQQLRIPGGRYHRVAQGETGIAIARAYGVEWSRVVALNGLEEPYVIQVGQRLKLPSTTEVRQMTLEERAAAFSIDIDDLITGSEPAAQPKAPPARPVENASRPVPATRPVAPPAQFSGRFAWPLEGTILRGFGPYGSGRRNEGINIAAETGTPIKAAADGVVAYVGTEIAVFGGLILIRHGGGWITTYGHASELLVTRGQSVKRGQVIARAGRSGSADRPQLHFQIRQGRKPVDPILYLPRR